MEREAHIVTLRPNGQITLPAELRKQVSAKAGDIFMAEVKEDDAIVLRRKHLVDASQAYFWSEDWQRGEREAQEDIRRGRVGRFRKAKDLITDLDR